ncbi:Rid family hydrolase [Streptomyces sp. NPDC005708]|uniref:Rid family hydrolase n=1 Tax=Streptomyces sp. NPDC005708 TaxID=3154564 RepID=UPI0034108928
MFRSIARAGDLIFVIGMIGRDQTGTVAAGVADQTLHALKRIEALLETQGVGREAIVRIRFFLVDIADWPTVMPLIEDFFSDDVPPAVALAVSALAEPSMRIEIEVEASTTTESVAPHHRADER